MNFPLFVARRYFLSKRRKNFINVIALLSMTGVAFATAALVVVLSVFNGIGGLLRSLYSAFDPPLKAVVVKGKSFEFSDSLRRKIYQVEGVAVVTEVIEDYVYVRNRIQDNEADMVLTLKGVSANFADQHRLDDYMVAGEFTLSRGDVPCAVVGAGVRNTLSVSLEDPVRPLQVYYVKNPGGSMADPSSMYASRQLLPAGVFAIEKNFDENYIIAPLEVAEELFGYAGRRTSLEIKTADGYTAVDVRPRLAALLGPSFQVLTNDEQHRDLYRLLRLEKVFTFFALSLLVVVASINIFFALMMLVIDKRKDMGILRALGADQGMVSRIFITEAFLVSGYGTLGGLIFGLLLCVLQQSLGLVGMGMENAVVSSYPVEMQPLDFLLVVGFNLATTLMICWAPARLAARQSASVVL